MPTKRFRSVPKPRGVTPPPSSGLKTAEKVRAEFEAQGIAVSAWARAHGLNRWTVFEVLHGRNKGCWGEAHRAAVLLGMKAGSITPPEYVAATVREVKAA